MNLTCRYLHASFVELNHSPDALLLDCCLLVTQSARRTVAGQTNKSMSLVPNSGQSELKTKHDGRDAQRIWRVLGEKKRRQARPVNLIIASLPREVCSQRGI